MYKEYYQKHKDRLNAARRKRYYENWDAERKRAREYIQEHRDELNEAKREAGRLLRIEVLTHYSTGDKPQCAFCGDDDFRVLCLDHINDDGAAHRKALGTKLYGTRNLGNKTGVKICVWLKRNNYPEGFQVLCGSCNMRKEYERRQAKFNGRNKGYKEGG